MAVVPEGKCAKYPVPEDDFSGDCVCIGCRRFHKSTLCEVYTPEGMDLRIRHGHCPVVGRWADWREDKPVKPKVKVRIGQQKQRR